MKRFTTILAATLFSLTIISVGYAATLKCSVTKVDDNVVTLECTKGADKLKPGMEVKVKTVSSSAAIEGC
ncbi:MAG: hypothetical protein ABFS19_10040 [Thermodesulfobacteriota bacterium]